MCCAWGNPTLPVCTPHLVTRSTVKCEIGNLVQRPTPEMLNEPPQADGYFNTCAVWYFNFMSARERHSKAEIAAKLARADDLARHGKLQSRSRARSG
jgi:hypothetical protein